MAYVDFMSPLHKTTTRDYLARVNDPEFPKAVAATAKTKARSPVDPDPTLRKLNSVYR